jgi:mono/diheme cytochrome c family protein
MKRPERLLWLAALTLFAGGCDFWYSRVPSPDNLWYVVPWFDHMIQAKYVRPYETSAGPRYTPPGIVPVTGGEPDWSAEWTTGKLTTADALRNPYAPNASEGARPSPPGAEVAVIPRDVDAAGDTLYQNYCAVCHGVAGDAKGPVSPRIGAPSLLTGRARAYSDGYLYSIIRYGRGVMPRHGDNSFGDCWAIRTTCGSPGPSPFRAPGAAADRPRPVPPARPEVPDESHLRERLVQRSSPAGTISPWRGRGLAASD